MVNILQDHLLPLRTGTTQSPARQFRRDYWVAE